MELFNPKNHTEKSLNLRIKMRNRQIYKLKQELGLISEKPCEFELLAQELGLEDFAKTLKQWKRK